MNVGTFNKRTFIGHFYSAIKFRLIYPVTTLKKLVLMTRIKLIYD